MSHKLAIVAVLLAGLGVAVPARSQDTVPDSAASAAVDVEKTYVLIRQFISSLVAEGPQKPTSPEERFQWAEKAVDQFRKMVEDQLLCEVKRETDVGGANDCKFGGQIQSAILADVDQIAQKVRRLKQDIETSASELDKRYGACNAVERMLRTYAQVLSDRQQGGGDPDQLAFEEALRNLRSAFEDRQLLAQAPGEASVWINDNGASRGTLTCASADASNYPGRLATRARSLGCSARPTARVSSRYSRRSSAGS